MASSSREAGYPDGQMRSLGEVVWPILTEVMSWERLSPLAIVRQPPPSRTSPASLSFLTW